MRIPSGFTDVTAWNIIACEAYRKDGIVVQIYQIDPGDFGVACYVTHDYIRDRRYAPHDSVLDAPFRNSYSDAVKLARKLLLVESEGFG